MTEKTWKDSNSLTEKGKAFIKFGIIWFVLVTVVSLIVYLWSTYPWTVVNNGADIFLITLFLNMPETIILLFIGAKRLKSCDVESQVTEGRKITYFGLVWIFSWIILPSALSYSRITDNAITGIFILFIGFPGFVIDTIIGKWLSNVNVAVGWEKLSCAQKALDLEKDDLEIEKQKIDNDRTSIERQKKEVKRIGANLEIQKEEIEKEKKNLKKSKEDLSEKTKEMEAQAEEIQKARDDLTLTWNELEKTIRNPFPFFLKKKLNKLIFIEEIEELKAMRPGDISLSKTKADAIESEVKDLLKIEINNIENEYYYEAFLEYFKKVRDPIEFDRIRAKYNPNIHNHGERRNKEWAERRRFDLSKIQKVLKESK